ncbi:hypothetical protein CRG98_010643 [Punica granatum]|uniref:Uncharacterized protein n=1 Tax=Punica granatum TaxID=22663 RepID=A0A2I0KL69_PUNGR|nr:hypothetical protein CRG98_010643 [Punica granatum]
MWVTTIGATPLSHMITSKDGRRELTRSSRGGYSTDPGSFSATHDTRSTAPNSRKHTTNKFKHPLSASIVAGVFKQTPSVLRSALATSPATDSTASSTFDDHARIATLEGTFIELAASMIELMAPLRGPNRASSSSTPPPGQGPMVDPNPWAPIQTRMWLSSGPHARFWITRLGSVHFPGDA